MPAIPANKPLVIGIASSALFDLTQSDAVYRKQGLKAYEKYQLRNEKKELKPGYAFTLIEKILTINAHLMGKHGLQTPVMEVVLLSRNTANTGLRVFNSIQKHKLDIRHAAFCGGSSPYAYAPAFGCKLFLSANAEDVGNCVQNGLAAARILEGSDDNTRNKAIKFAFDGDAVLFSDEAEKVTEKKGISAFQESEKKNANEQLNPGPFKPFLESLSHIQQHYFPEETGDDDYSIRTALVTARGAPAHERAILTLRKWDIPLNVCLFVGNHAKGGFLKAFSADIFFDDKEEHCQSANARGVPGALVPRMGETGRTTKNKRPVSSKA